MISFASMFPEEITRAFAWTLIHSVWQGGLLALLAAGVIVLLRRHRPVVRYTLLCILLALIPLLFAGTFMYYYNQEKTDRPEITVTGTSSAIENQFDSNNAVEISEKSDHNLILFSSRLIDNQANLLVLIWFTGFLFFLFRFTGSLLFVYRMKNTRIYPVDKSREINMQRLSDRIGLKKQVRLVESALAKVPLTIGYLKPVILLPLGTLSGVPPQQVDAILLHELAHIRRKDYLVNILQSIVEMLFFYHPASWWLSGLIRQEREHICDDIAVGVNQDHLNYIKALTTMEEFNAKSPLLANAVTGSKKKLLSRVKRLISPGKLRKGMGEGIIVFLVIIGLVSALSLNALTVIPDSFDLTGRESGEKVYNLLPYNPSNPDTIKAVSKSGNVAINVYTDSVTEGQQKALQEMAESIDKKEGNLTWKEEKYIVRVESPRPPHPIHREERKVVVISRCDSTEPGSKEYSYIYTSPDTPEGEDVKVKIFHFDNDSIDTLIIVNPHAAMSPGELDEFQWNVKEMEEMTWEQQKEFEEFHLSEEAMQDQMKDIQMEIEYEIPEGDFEGHEFYFEEPVIAPIPPMQAFEHEGHGPSAERIIRQELRDDGLTVRGRKYVIELDSKAMYINGEKQAKEVYKKYRKLVESMEQMSLEGEETFKLIF